MTNHSGIDYEQLVEDADLVIDLRNATGQNGTLLREGLEAVTVTVGVAGLGHWGPNLARNFADLAELTWLCDSARERSDVASRYPQARFTGDFDEMLADTSLDAVVVATPVPTHFELARRALGAGKHVLVEKPPAMTGSEMDELVSLAASASSCSCPATCCSTTPVSASSGT